MRESDESSVEKAVEIPPPTVHEATLREGLLTAGFGVAVYLLLSFVFFLGAGGAPLGDRIGSVMAATLSSWGVLLWLGAVAAIMFVGRHQTVRHRTRWIVAAGLGAGLTNETIRFAPAIASSGPMIVLLVGIPLLTAIGAYVVAFGGGRLLAVQLLPNGQRRAESRERMIRIAGIVLLAVAWIAILALGRQWFTVYFRLFGSPATVSDDQSRAYLVTAAIAITAAVATIVFAVRRRASLPAAVATLVVAVLVAFVLQVPAGRFWPKPAPPPLPYNNHAPCMGEGDPNCRGG